MLEYIKSILNNNTPQGKIDVTVFFVDVFLLLCHILLMIVYLFSKNILIITTNIFSILIYLYFVFNCTKKMNVFVVITYLEILSHIVIASIAFGLSAGFQNWSYGLLCACFLATFTPLTNEHKLDKRPYIFAFISVITYFVLIVALHDYKSDVHSLLTYNILYTMNSVISFASIIMFSIFYTSKSIRKQNELSRRADYDELTSLYNRYALNQIGNNCIHQAKMAKANFSVAIIDIDYFKNINDTYGHAKGDDVLKELSSIIRSFSIRGIIPGRWGGEEFIMIAPYTIDYNEFCVVLEKLREKIEKYKFAITAKNNLAITISIGASSVKNVSTLDEAVSLADKNLYQAKESGRNKLVSWYWIIKHIILL